MSNFRMLLITQEDPFYVRLFFEEFFKRYSPLSDIQGIVVAPTMGKKSLWKLVRQMIGFYGVRDFIRMGFRFAAYRIGAKFAQWIPMKRFYSIAQVSRHYGIPVYFYSNLNGEPFLKFIRSLDLDLIVSVAAPQIFREPLIRVPKEGCINIHNSKLPKYRGMLPNFWQMYHGEKSVGTTVHRINAGIDDGDILLQKETPLREGETLDSIIRRTKKLGADILIEAIRRLREGTLTPLPNPAHEGSYYTFPTPEEVKAFRKKGFRLI
jgi:methionyl-tRNA formyltransferase